MKKRLVASENAGDSALGHLIWFSVGDLEITRSDIEDLAGSVNLPERLLPAPIRSVDAFRRATGEVGGTISGTEHINEVLLVREVSSDKEGVVRHLIKETADKKNKRLIYNHCGTFKYDRERENMWGTAYSEEVSPFVEKANTLFQKYKNYYTADHIRRMIKSALFECQSVPLRPSGAVYFIPKKHENTIRSLRDFVKQLPAESTEIHLMPVVDMDEQREMLEAKLRSHIASEVSKIGAALGGNPEILTVKHGLRKLAGNLAEVLKSNPSFSKTVVNNAVEQFQAMSLQVKEYESLLETNLGEVRSTLDILRKQMVTMLDRVENDYDIGFMEFATAK